MRKVLFLFAMILLPYGELIDWSITPSCDLDTYITGSNDLVIHTNEFEAIYMQDIVE